MSARRWLFVAGGVVVIVAAVVVAVLVSGNNDSSHSSASSVTTTSRSGARSSSSTSTTGPLVTNRGGVTAATGANYGQAPSNGYCAHWTERFVNDSDVKVVHITFAPKSAGFTSGTAGEAGYRRWPAKTPSPTELNVSIATKQAQTIQFQSCTTTAPPNGATLHIVAPATLQWTWADGARGRGKL